MDLAPPRELRARAAGGGRAARGARAPSLRGEPPALYLPYISATSPLHLPCISPTSPLHLRSKVTHLRTWIVHNPEERSLLGFFAGWCMLLCSPFVTSRFVTLPYIFVISPLPLPYLSPIGSCCSAPPLASLTCSSTSARSSSSSTCTSRCSPVSARV